MASSRNLIIHVQSPHWIASYNTQTNEYKNPVALRNYGGNVTNFFGQLQSMFNLKHVKAIAFTFVGTEFSTFNECYNFRRKCYEFCQKNQIFCLFVFAALFPASSAISQTKTMVKEGEKVMVFLVDFPGMPPSGFGIIRKNNSYRYISNSITVHQPFTQKWQEDIFQDLKPEKIIFIEGGGSNGVLEKAQKFFKSYDCAVVTYKQDSDHFMDLVDNVLHLTGEKINPYHIEVISLGRFHVRYNGKTLIEATEFDILPFEKSVIVRVIPKKSISLYCAFPLAKPPELVKEIKLSTFKTKKVKVTFKLDINSFHDFKVEPFVGEEEENKENVAEKCCEAKPSKEIVVDSASDDPILPEKAQMVFDKQHFSISYFTDGKEHIVNDSNGETKTPIYIAFTEKKRIIGKAAMEIYSEKPKFVVFDLIKLCSVSTEDICNPKWGFKLSKEEEEKGKSLFLTFETLEGKTKSTVELLLALILKNGRDRIKKETGKIFEEIEIKFDGFSPNEILKKNFIKAAKLLKINIVFV